MDLRFDDSLETVLTADMSTAFGAQTAWRQLVDLIGRGRAPASDIAITRLRSIRPQVPATIRAASARALAFARPPAPLVRLFAEEDLAISAPVLRMAELSTAEWIAMLPDISPAARSVLRLRRDLAPEVGRSLESFGPIDFILPAAARAPEAVPALVVEPVADVNVDSQIDPVLMADVVSLPPQQESVTPDSDIPVMLPVWEDAAPVDSRVETTAPTIEPDVQPAEVPIGQIAAPEIFAPNDIIPSGEGSLATPVLPVVADGTGVAVEPQPLVELPQLAVSMAEPLSIDWTEVIAARPAERLLAVPKPRLAPQPLMRSAEMAPAPVVSAPADLPTVVFEPLAEPVTEPAPEARVEPTVEPDLAATEDVDVVPPSPNALDQGGAWSFVSISSVAFGLPVVIEALRQTDEQSPSPVETAANDHAPNLSDADIDATPIAETAPVDADPIVAVEAESPLPLMAEPAVAETKPDAITPRGPFQISDLVARIDAFQRQRDETGQVDPNTAIANDVSLPVVAPEGFTFETDARGVICWVSGVSRAAVIGISLDLAPKGTPAHVDGIAAGAFRRRSAFTQARLLVDGQSDAAGQWRISGVPAFDRTTGRFTGYRGTARRPRADERAEPEQSTRSPATDSLRQLVHELRTPTTAIAGFAEMIEGELLGPVPGPYRDYAGTIRDQAMGLLGAIDDLDTAARIEAHALELRPTDIPVALLLQRIAHDLEPLASLRGTALALDIAAGDVAIRGDDRAVDRLFGRLLAALVSAGSAGETIGLRMGREGDETVAIHIDRPRALAAYANDALLTIDAEAEAEAIGAPLLGTGFALRLARNLAVELGGSLTIGVDRLTLRLPAAFTHDVGQASTI